MSLQSANIKYLSYLSKYPLFTKSVTAGTLAGLNEIIASILTRDFKSSEVAGRKVKHVFSPKLLTMIFYGSFIVTPISHKLYGILNKIFKGKTSVLMRLLQILVSLTTVTPILSVTYASWVSIINGYRLPEKSKDLQIHKEIEKIINFARTGLNRNFYPIFKSSLMTSFVSLVIAQKFVAPELWVVFFNVIYFVLGTIQNTKMKSKRKTGEQ